MAYILVAEDDTHISGMLCALLEQNGHRVRAAYSGTEAELVFGLERFDLVLLDMMLPGKSGGEVLENIRQRGDVPVIAVTAVSDSETIAAILRAGAEDYVVKPFDNDVLLARIEVQLRRGRRAEDGEGDTLTLRGLTLHLDRYDGEIGGVALGLSRREFEILSLLMRHPKKVFTKANLYESVWAEEFMGDDNTVNVHISKLRGKLAAVSPDTAYIQTVWGIGFKMQE